jgi:hypothetical protein
MGSICRGKENESEALAERSKVRILWSWKGLGLDLSCVPYDSVHVLKFGGKDLDVLTAVSPVTLRVDHILDRMEKGVSMLPIEAAEEVCHSLRGFYQTGGQSELCWKEVIYGPGSTYWPHLSWLILLIMVSIPKHQDIFHKILKPRSCERPWGLNCLPLVTCLWEGHENLFMPWRNRESLAMRIHSCSSMAIFRASIPSLRFFFFFCMTVLSS